MQVKGCPTGAHFSHEETEAGHGHRLSEGWDFMAHWLCGSREHGGAQLPGLGGGLPGGRSPGAQWDPPQAEPGPAWGPPSPRRPRLTGGLSVPQGNQHSAAEVSGVRAALGGRVRRG